MLWLQEWMISGSNSPRDLNPIALELFFDNQKNQSVMSRDSHVRKNFLPRPPNGLKFSDLVVKITEIISILVQKFYDNHKRR